MKQLNRRQMEDLAQLSKNDKFCVLWWWFDQKIQNLHEELETESRPHQIAQLQGQIRGLRDISSLFETEIPAVLSMPADIS